MTVDNNLLPSSLDRQISTADQDAFGHRHFAHALRSLIECEKIFPPYSIGLLGGWGTGKSSIKELYVNDLRDDARKNKAGHTRLDRFYSITFNAWRFGGKDQDIKRALLRHVFLELGGDDENLQERLFKQISESRDETKTWCQYTWEILKAWAMPIPAFILSILLLFGLLFLALKYLPLQGSLSQSFFILVFTGAFSYLLREVKPPTVAAHRPVTRITLPSTTAEQYEDLLLEQITKFKSGQASKHSGIKGKACERLVVFVDDLDRLSAEEMVLGLDAVRTFMEIPEARLPKGIGLVFIISCDETRVADALAKGRRQGELPGTVFTHSDARRYLDRIFQFRLEIPPFPRHDMRQYAIKKLKDFPGLIADLHIRGVTIDALVDRMIHVGVQNPRNALQIVNAFAQAWWLAKKRETEELGTDRPGGLHEGAVTGHPISLGAISAIKVDFPDFYRDLQQDPALLHRITDVLVRRKSLEDLPLTTQQILTERYLLKQSDKKMPIEVRPEQRPLRQFLASLIGIRWPDSLQSFVLLSEDPITRKFGARSIGIYEALISGDTQGVLEGLGRHIDASTLKQDEARLLSQMAEGLRTESNTLRTNASRVIADLVDRLPADTAHLLVGTLCRELDDSDNLRSQLGIMKIGKVLTVAHHDDRKAIASRLVEDVLTVNEDVRFRLETLEPPNLEEAIDFARTTLALALPIRRELGLDNASDTQLLKWLVERIIKIGGKSFQLPFADFEQCMADHEDHLLISLSDRYTDLLADELAVETEHDFDTSSAIKRARKVFDTQWAAGEDTRPKLWKDLTRYVSLKLPDASRTAWEVMIEHITSPNTSQISEFIMAFVERLSKEAQDENWSLDFDLGAQALLTIIRTRLADLDKATNQMLSDLAILWSEDEKAASLSCDVIIAIWPVDAETAQQTLANWCDRILDNLPLDCVKLFASFYPRLSESLQASTITKLQTDVINNGTIDKPTGERYKAFIESVPQSAWDSAPLKGHLDTLLPQIAARHNNPNHYLERIFPAIVGILQHASPNILGQSLQNLFTQAKGQLSHYAWLHFWMVGRWPKRSTELNSYNPEQIFLDGNSFAVSHSEHSSNGLLRSLCDMLTRELVSADQRSALIKSACATWAVDPEKAIETFTSGFSDLTPEQTANLADPIDWTNEAHQELLTRAWSAIAQVQDESIQIQSTNRILEKGPCGHQDEPDSGLSIWLDALGESRRNVIGAAITQADLNDVHRKRLWQQAVRFKDALSAGFFIDIIPKIVVFSSIEETAISLFTDYELISGLLGSADNRADLSQRLMEIFSNVSTNTIKAHIAEWCKKLSGEASLRMLKSEDLTDDDLKILYSHFPGASTLKKIEKALNSSSAHK